MPLTSVRGVFRAFVTLLTFLFRRIPVFIFQKLIRPVCNWMRRVAAAVAVEWTRDFRKGPVKALSSRFLAIVICCALVVIGWALSMRWLRPMTSISISDFEIPSNAPVSGKTLARLVSEELSQINSTNRRGDPFDSRLTHYIDIGALQTEALAVPALGGVSVWGVSADSLAAAWQFLRTDEQSVSAELIGPVGGPFHLHASVSSSRARGSWDQPVTGTNGRAFQQACVELAHQILSKLSPQAMGRYYLLTAHPDLALAQFQHWQLLQPKDPEPLFYAGWAYDVKADMAADSAVPEASEQKKQFRALASAAYHQALALDPNHAESTNGLGIEADAVGDHVSASKYYSTASNAQPSDPTFLTNLASCLADQEKFVDAFPDYERALQFDSTFAGAWWNYGIAIEQVPEKQAASSKKLAECLRTNTDFKTCQHQEARRAYETAVSSRPDFTEALIDLARVVRDDQPSRSVATASEAIQILEKDTTYPRQHALRRAQAYEIKCRAEENEALLDQAQADCRSATQLDAGNKRFADHAAAIVYEIKCRSEESETQLDQAQADCQLALQLDPGSKFFAEHADAIAKKIKGVRPAPATH